MTKRFFTAVMWVLQRSSKWWAPISEPNGELLGDEIHPYISSVTALPSWTPRSSGTLSFVNHNSPCDLAWHVVAIKKKRTKNELLYPDYPTRAKQSYP